jgi:hypothetical protein
VAGELLEIPDHHARAVLDVQVRRLAVQACLGEEREGVRARWPR